MKQDQIPLLSLVEVEGRQGVVRARAASVVDHRGVRTPARYDVMFGTEIAQSIAEDSVKFLRGPTPEELSWVVGTCDAGKRAA